MRKGPKEFMARVHDMFQVEIEFQVNMALKASEDFSILTVIQNARFRLFIRKWSSYRNKNSFSSRL